MSGNDQFQVHAVRVVVTKVAHEFVPSGRESDGGPADRARFDTAAFPF